MAQGAAVKGDKGLFHMMFLLSGSGATELLLLFYHPITTELQNERPSL
jgi:hypothetical protein